MPRFTQEEGDTKKPRRFGPPKGFVGFLKPERLFAG